MLDAVVAEPVAVARLAQVEGHARHILGAARHHDVRAALAARHHSHPRRKRQTRDQAGARRIGRQPQRQRHGDTAACGRERRHQQAALAQRAEPESRPFEQPLPRRITERLEREGEKRRAPARCPVHHTHDVRMLIQQDALRAGPGNHRVAPIGERIDEPPWPQVFAQRPGRHAEHLGRRDGECGVEHAQPIAHEIGQAGYIQDILTDQQQATAGIEIGSQPVGIGWRGTARAVIDVN